MLIGFHNLLTNFPEPFSKRRYEQNEKQKDTDSFNPPDHTGLDPANAATGHKDNTRQRRTLAYVFMDDGTLLNAEIIKQGYGFALTRYPFAINWDRMRRLIDRWLPPADICHPISSQGNGRHHLRWEPDAVAPRMARPVNAVCSRKVCNCLSGFQKGVDRKPKNVQNRE
jgi:hypothetical protein